MKIFTSWDDFFRLTRRNQPSQETVGSILNPVQDKDNGKHYRLIFLNLRFKMLKLRVSDVNVRFKMEVFIALHQRHYPIEIQ